MYLVKTDNKYYVALDSLFPCEISKMANGYKAYS